MHTYIAASSRARHDGGLRSCLEWAFRRVADNPREVVKLLAIRPRESVFHKARVIAEVTVGGGRWIAHGRFVSLKRVLGVPYG